MIGNLTYWGEFFAIIGVGTPAQYVPVQVDTGSVDLIIYSPQCGTGCNATATYDYTASSTSNAITCEDTDYYCNQDDCNFDPDGTCDWEDDYGDGASIKGQVVTDVITVGNRTTTSTAALGPINSVNAPGGFEATGVDGIWGFAFQPLSGWQGDPVFDTLVGDFNLYDSFDMCLFQNNGVLNLGQDFSKDSRFQWTPIQQDVWYTVYIEDWLFGGVSLGISAYDLNWNGVIVDSGTTLIIVDQQINAAIQKLFYSYCPTVKLPGICGLPLNASLFGNQCFQMTNQQVNQFPNMTISMYNENANFPLTISPSDYLWQGAGVPGYYCLGIQEMDGLGVILGDVLIQAFHVVFDVAQDAVGFGPLSSC